MKKVLKWTSIVLLLVVVLPLAVLLVVNAFDEKLDPRAAAYGETRATVVPDAENGYYAVLAVGAPDGADSMDYAKAWVAEARAAGRENRAENRTPPKRAKRPDLCDAALVACLAVARDKAADVAALLEAYREDLERYEKLLAFRRYEEVMDYPLRLDAQIPSYAGVASAQRAYLMRAALAVQAGNVEEALSALEREFAFQRGMLQGARTLIGKMVATGLTMRDLAFVADLLQNNPAGMKPHAVRLAAMLQPVNVVALHPETMFESEFGWVKQAYRDPSVGKAFGEGLIFESVAISLFYKKNATLNKAYETYAAMGAASLKPARNVAAEFQQLPGVSGKLALLDYIDNPVGKILMGIAVPSFEGYVLRLHDLDAYNRLLGLGVEMLAADVGAEGAAAFVAKSDVRFHDPYTGKPMAWDAAPKRLSFKVSDNTARRKLVDLDKGRLYLQW